MPERVQGGNKNMKLNKPIIKKVEFLAEDKHAKPQPSLSLFLTGRMFVRRTYFGHFDEL